MKYYIVNKYGKIIIILKCKKNCSDSVKLIFSRVFLKKQNIDETDIHPETKIPLLYEAARHDPDHAVHGLLR